MNKTKQVHSMTGFGEARFSDGVSEYRICVSSVNHKFLDISTNFPHGMYSLEQEARDCLRRKIKRGRVSIILEKEGPKANPEIIINRAAVKKYIDSVKKLSVSFGLAGEIDPLILLNLPGVISTAEARSETEKLKNKFKQALKKAVSNFIAMRETEGAGLKRSMQNLTVFANGRVKAVEKRSGIAKKRKQAQLKAKIEEAGINSSDAGFPSAVVNLVNRMEIDEEIVRLKSHLRQFEDELCRKPSGVKLDFILQEMQREANTVAAKSQDVVITRKIIEIKTALQKLKEQVQNIE